jgi:hypothetical protein
LSAPIGLRLCEQTLAAVQAQMEPQASEAARAAGRALAMTQATDLATLA